MRFKISVLISMLIVTFGCATTPEVLVEDSPYPSIIEWENVNKDELYDDLILALHMQNDYQVVPMTTSKDSGFVLAGKGDHNDLYYNVVKRVDGKYHGYYSVRYTLKFLIKEDNGSAQILINPNVKIYCKNSDSWTGAVWYTACDYKVSANYIPTLESGITARLNEDITLLIDSMKLQDKTVVERDSYKITRL